MSTCPHSEDSKTCTKCENESPYPRTENPFKILDEEAQKKLYCFVDPKEIEIMQEDANRYRWLRDNGFLDGFRRVDNEDIRINIDKAIESSASKTLTDTT